MDIQKHHMIVHQKLRLKEKKSTSQQSSNVPGCAYVEDLKDPVKVLPPSGDRAFIHLLVETTRNRVSFTLLDKFPLHVGHGPAIETFVSVLLIVQAAN